MALKDPAYTYPLVTPKKYNTENVMGHHYRDRLQKTVTLVLLIHSLCFLPSSSLSLCLPLPPLILSLSLFLSLPFSFSSSPLSTPSISPTSLFLTMMKQAPMLKAVLWKGPYGKELRGPPDSNHQGTEVLSPIAYEEQNPANDQ